MSGTGKKDKHDEEDCTCYAESHSKKTCPPVHNVTHPLRYYEFTQEEIKALEECDKESFYQRCLPFSTLFATLTYAAIRNGEDSSLIVGSLCGSVELHGSYLNKSVHFGAAPKVMVAILFGHVLGRLSYMKSCDAKLRLLPGNSYLGNVMRKHHATSQSAKP